MEDGAAAARGGAAAPAPKIPITLLSGFLGAGKTTLLREVLQNKGGFKVAVVVNDVAKVNIDSKLVRERTGKEEGDLADCMELQNGCACCNASDELLQSILQLMRLSQRRGYAYDRIIIELSGVAEPKNIRREFVEAAEAQHLVMTMTELQNMITVVDSPNFISLYQSRDDISSRPDLCKEEDDAMEADSDRKVVDLLVEQVECADYVILNKQDRCEGDQGKQLEGIVGTINPTARILRCEWGKVPLETVMGPPTGASWVCKADDEDDLREAVRAARELGKRKERDSHSEASHGHGHSHAHEHVHEHGGGEDCSVCDTDKKKSAPTSAATRFGITSFVYARRRPFHPQRLMKVIMHLPVKVDPQSGQLVDAWEFPGSTPENDKVDVAEGAAMRTIIRSKGFVWIANQHRSAQYWSHAGHYFELRALGLWWAATALTNWPDEGQKESGEVSKIAMDFAQADDPAAEWGDRRQEVVFIGIKMDQAAIERLLDACLLDDAEMESYRQQAANQGKDVVKVTWSGDVPTPAPVPES